jgi:hypothetical protein
MPDYKINPLEWGFIFLPTSQLPLLPLLNRELKIPEEKHKLQENTTLILGLEKTEVYIPESNLVVVLGIIQI